MEIEIRFHGDTEDDNTVKVSDNHPTDSCYTQDWDFGKDTNLMI